MVVLSPDYDGPLRDSLCRFTALFQLADQPKHLRGNWPGNSSLLWQPKEGSGEEATASRGGAHDRWMDGWIRIVFEIIIRSHKGFSGELAVSLRGIWTAQI